MFGVTIGAQSATEKTNQKSIPREIQARNQGARKESKGKVPSRRLPPLMSCNRPLWGYKNPGGRIVFNASQGCPDLRVAVPCGQCYGCRKRRAQDWAVRCLGEAEEHEQTCFLTLTYDEQSIPSDGSLDVSHWQNFAKRVRKQCGPFRFFHCGEYGSKRGRPHYHALVYGLDWREESRPHESQPGGDPLYASPVLDQLWPQGIHAIGELTFASACYVSRYVIKKITGKKAADHYGGRKPEYTTMSRKPGIGQLWINKYMDEVYDQDLVVMAGRKSQPPAYYDEQLRKANPDAYRWIKARRRVTAKSKEHQLANSIHQLRIKETIQIARDRELTRGDGQEKNNFT